MDRADSRAARPFHPTRVFEGSLVAHQHTSLAEHQHRRCIAELEEDAVPELPTHRP